VPVDALQRLRSPATRIATLLAAVALSGCVHPLRPAFTIHTAPPPDDEPDGVGATFVYAGARAQHYSTSEGALGGRSVTVGAQGGAEMVAMFSKVVVSAGVHGALGGGARPDGLLRAHVEAGRRVVAWDDHGLVLRLGIDGSFLASERLDRATLETPRFGMGWRMLTNRHLIEVMTDVRVAVLSRFAGGGAAQRAFEPIAVPGLSAVVQWTPVRVEGTYMFTRGGSFGSLNEIHGAACWAPFEPALTCVNASYSYVTSAPALTAPPLESSVVGISVGLGRMVNGYAVYARDE